MNWLATFLRDRQAPHLHRWMVRRARSLMNVTDRPAIVVAPHHDDETFGCGGMIALKRDRGARVGIVALTDGSYSHSADPTIARDALVSIRNGELLEAGSILGVAQPDVHFMNLPDNRLRHLPADVRRAAVGKLANLLREYQAREVYVPHHADRHPDHEAAFSLTIDAIAEAALEVEIFEYPIWLIWLGPLRLLLLRRNLAGGMRLPIEAARSRKDRAVEVYRSQLHLLPPGFLGQFEKDCEIFFKWGRPGCESR